MIDWTNIEDVESLNQLIQDMDFKGEITNIEEFEDKIKEAAKAIKKFNLDAIKEQVKSIEDLTKDLEDREDTERTFTKEERDLMIGADPSLTG